MSREQLAMSKEQRGMNKEKRAMNKDRKALLTLLFVICYLTFVLLGDEEKQ